MAQLEFNGILTNENNGLIARNLFFAIVFFFLLFENPKIMSKLIA
jgi:hypothetical protein